MSDKQDIPAVDAVEVRLFIEELACDICRFAHASTDGVAPESVRITQEFQLEAPNAFADIVVHTPSTNYIVEVAYGAPPERIVRKLAHKYRRDIGWFREISKLIVIFDGVGDSERPRLEGQLRAQIPKHWQLELWDDRDLLSRIRDHFGIEIDSLRPDVLSDVRTAIDRAKGTYAFGHAYEQSPLDSTLLWHFGYWRLKEAFTAANGDKRAILPPTTYRAAAIVFADLSGFSGYVRDTPRLQTIRECLTAFSSRSRYQIINHGGMVYQFLGDAVIGFFGIPNRTASYVDEAFECARSLLMLGESVSNEWQRQLDRMQPVRGSHIGIALGDLELLSLRPFSPTHIGAVGDVINMAARLSSFAQPGQIAVSNLVYQKLSDDAQKLLSEVEPVEAKNIGRIKAWVTSERADGV